MWNKKDFIHLLIILVFLIFSRLAFLNLLPVSLVHDETVYAIQAKSFATSGKTVDQQQSWFSFQPVNPMYAELPAVILTPGFWVTSNNLLASHLMPAILGIMFPFAFAWLMHGLWKNKKLTLISCYIVAVNPFFWQFSRLSYDAFFSVFFYVLGAAILVNLSSWIKLTSIPLFILGFFEYQGLKLVLIPWVLGILTLQFLETKKDVFLSWGNLKSTLLSKSQIPSLITLVAVLLLTTFYGLVLLPNQNLNNRTKATIFSDQTIPTTVNNDRRLTINSSLTNLFINKPINMVSYMGEHFAQAFNPRILFLKGEPISNFAVTTHGIFYLLDIVLIIGGFYFLLRRQKGIYTIFVLLGLLGVLALPVMINTMSEWYLIRTHLSYLILLFFISWGGYVISRLPKIKVVFAVVYILGVAYFSYQYFYRYPLLSADRANVTERVMARYISLVQDQNPEQPVIVHTSSPEFVFSSFLLYTNKLNKNTAYAISKQFNSNKNLQTQGLSLGKVVFTNNCSLDNQESIHIFDSLHWVCNQEEQVKIRLMEKPVSIPLVVDSGERYKIINDAMCNQYNLNTYIWITSLKQFQIDQMSAQNLCQTWFTNINNLAK